VTWTCIPRSQVIVASDAGAALAMLMERYSNESLEVLLDSIHSAIIAEIRLYYGVQISRRRRPRQLSLELPPEGD